MKWELKDFESNSKEKMEIKQRKEKVGPLSRRSMRLRIQIELYSIQVNLSYFSGDQIYFGSWFFDAVVRETLE